MPAWPLFYDAKHKACPWEQADGRNAITTLILLVKSDSLPTMHGQWMARDQVFCANAERGA